jgi:hypothetical protein
MVNRYIHAEGVINIAVAGIKAAWPGDLICMPFVRSIDWKTEKNVIQKFKSG